MYNSLAYKLKDTHIYFNNVFCSQVGRNEALAVELLNLVNAKATLMRQLTILTNGDPKIGNPDAEIDRIKIIVNKYSSGRVKVSKLIDIGVVNTSEHQWYR